MRAEGGEEVGEERPLSGHFGGIFVFLESEREEEGRGDDERVNRGDIAG